MFAAGVYSDGGGIHRHIPVPFGYEGGGAS
jgi:hypothetical protein